MSDRSYSHGDLVVVLEGDNRGRIGQACVETGWDTIGVQGDGWSCRVYPHGARKLLYSDRIALAHDDVIPERAAERFGDRAVFIH